MSHVREDKNYMTVTINLGVRVERESVAGLRAEL